MTCKIFANGQCNICLPHPSVIDSVGRHGKAYEVKDPPMLAVHDVIKDVSKGSSYVKSVRILLGSLSSFATGGLLLPLGHIYGPAID